LPATIVLATLGMTLGATPSAGQSPVRLEADAKLILSDNPFLLGGDDTESAAVEITARPEATWSLGPASSLDLSGVAAYRRYTRRYGDFLTGRADLEINHRDSEFLSLGGRVSYARDLPADALTESIDFSVDSRTIRESVSAHSSIEWNPSAHMQITGAAGWEKLRYPGSAWLSSISAYHLDLGASRRVSETTSLGAEASATFTDMAGSGNLSAKAIRATVAHRLGPIWQANAQLGVEWTGVDAPGGEERGQLSGSGRLCYQPERLELCATTSLQSEVSGFAGLQREFHIGMMARRRLDERSSLSGSAAYRSAELGVAGNRTKALHLATAYERRLSEMLSLTGSVDYLNRTFLTGERNDAVILRIGIAVGRERR
jgi:hypothetical protein